MWQRSWLQCPGFCDAYVCEGQQLAWRSEVRQGVRRLDAGGDGWTLFGTFLVNPTRRQSTVSNDNPQKKQ
jgi:hypothetical protein